MATARRRPDPLALVQAVRRAARDADGQDPLDEAASLHLEHTAPADLVLRTAYPAGSDEAAGTGGFALVRGDELDLVVAPDSRGHGLGRELMGWALEVAAPVHAWSHGHHPAAAPLARRFGWACSRDLWVMRRPVGAEAPPLPDRTEPEGVSIRGFAGEGPDSGEARAVLDVNAAAFAHHPEQGSLDREGLAERMAQDWWDPAGLLVAVDTGRPGSGEAGRLLGFHWTKQHDATTGEVYVVGISPAAQGRGLGRALTLAGLHHLAGLGVSEIILYVESDNAAAVHVYEGLGFTHAPRDTHVQFSAPQAR